jgi:hypothetical protein
MSDQTLEMFEEGYRACMWVLETFEAEVEGELPSESEPELKEFQEQVTVVKEQLCEAWDELCKARGDR